MYADMYYILTALSFVFFFFALIFSWEEMIKIDQNGREYNASIFIAIPLSIIGILLHIILAFNSWNIETLYVVGNTVQVYATEDFFYFLAFHVFMFFFHVALLFLNVFNFYIDQVKAATKPRYKEERMWE